jgi:hypothetical protein
VTSNISFGTVYQIPVEVPEQHHNPVDLGLCVSLTYWYHDPHRIVEWIEIQRFVGISRIIVYNNSMAVETSNIFLYYQEIYPDLLELRQSWNFIQDNGELILHAQMSPVLNDCMYAICTTLEKY